MYKYFNTLHRFTDYRRIFSATSRSNNADGYAIDKVADIMKESKARDKIMVVVSDGQPSAHGYGGASGEQHVQDVVNRLESEGITVIQVCMAYIENSPRMFKHFVPYEKDGTFFDNLKKILLTKLNQFADSI
jgi:nitric oxide reductase activation protein